MFHLWKSPLISLVFVLCVCLKFKTQVCDGFTAYSSVTIPTQAKSSTIRKHSPRIHARNIQNQQPEEEIQVFDNVFSSYACEELVYLTRDHSERGNDGSSVFTRPPNNDKPLTPIEHAIDSFLISIDDTTQKVEYWSRDEYINIDAHADIDEEQLEDDEILRCPQMGHVLYLEVEEGLKGPTCVFPSKRFGWDNQYEYDVDSTNSDEEEVEMVIVPAVKSRVLRFPGNAMHSVPCPANRWLLSKDEEGQLRREEEDEENCANEDNVEDDFFDEDYGDDDDLDYDDIERSVLLFNTWPDDEQPPKGVNGDYVTGSLPEGIELSEEDTLSFLKSEEAQRLTEWNNEYGLDSEKLRCNTRQEWECIKIESTNCDDDARVDSDVIRIGLMGNQNRRLWKRKFVNLSVASGVMETALTQTSKPSLIKSRSVAKEG